MPFKPGKSGNPLGRPKGAKGFAKRAREALFAVGPEHSETAFETICKVARNDGHQHWPHAIKLLVGRAFGKELSLVELTGKDGAPLFGQLTDEQLEARYRALQEKIAAQAALKASE